MPTKSASPQWSSQMNDDIEMFKHCPISLSKNRKLKMGFSGGSVVKNPFT